MKIIVKKFGGTSVQDDEARKQALKHVAYAVDEGYKVAVVVSAIGRQGAPYATDSLLQLVGGKATKLDNRELDMVVSIGEVISAAVFTQLVKKSGFKATALTGSEAGIRTNNDYQNAKVLNVEVQNVMEAFEDHDVVVIAGFQGLSNEGHVTTLGRGGSDTSAALLGVALQAKRCDIFTDVSGMMTGDPRIVERARYLKEVSYDEVVNMAHEGAKVIHPRAVQVAQQGHLPLTIRSTWDAVDEMGTLISDHSLGIQHYRSVTGVAHQTGLTQFKVSTQAHTSQEIFKLLADNHLSVDFININLDGIVFNLTEKEAQKAIDLFTQANVEATYTEHCAKVSIIGAGIMGTPGITAKMVQALAQNRVKILQTTDSYTTIWVLVHEDQLVAAVNALHDSFLVEA